MSDDPRDLAQLRMLQTRHLTRGGNTVGLHPEEGDTGIPVTFTKPEIDTNYGVHASLNWDSTWWVRNKTVTGFTLFWSVVAPADALVDTTTLRAG